MEYRRLGDSDLRVSVISLGSWLTYGGGVGDAQAEACVQKAFEDKDRLLGYMGHATDDMLLDNYLRAVDRKTAARYWQIEPPAAPRKRAADER